ncbi:hypothetical protein N0V88_008033 [Collariella sp. IMI 366227]|nr:hypothetical protein N0V88_008033 [Collariella sp. IMI 366227]
MVYGIFYLPTPLSDLLRQTHHFDDSKVLTPPFSWGTAKDMLDAAPARGGGVKVEWPADENPDTQRLTDYFGAKDQDADELGTWFGTPAGVEAF